jgi:hypothetical protein
LILPFDEIDHPLIAKANEQFTGSVTARERIAAIDDQILFKVKVQRWRGAVWEGIDLGWLVGAGWRENGSTRDFYADLSALGIAARKRHNTTHSGGLKANTYVAALLPTDDDQERYRAEGTVRFARRLGATIHDLLRRSLCDGREYTAGLAGFTLGIQVRADHGHETYVAVRVAGPVPSNLTITILELVPGCDPTQWDYAESMPDRALHPGEVAYLNLMDPTKAAKLLDNE